MGLLRYAVSERAVKGLNNSAPCIRRASERRSGLVGAATEGFEPGAINVIVAMADGVRHLSPAALPLLGSFRSISNAPLTESAIGIASVAFA